MMCVLSSTSNGNVLLDDIVQARSIKISLVMEESGLIHVRLASEFECWCIDINAVGRRMTNEVESAHDQVDIG